MTRSTEAGKRAWYQECGGNGLAADDRESGAHAGRNNFSHSLRAERPVETSEGVEVWAKHEGLLPPEDSR